MKIADINITLAIVAVIVGFLVAFLLSWLNRRRTGAIVSKVEKVLGYTYGKPVRVDTFSLLQIWKWLEQRDWTGCQVLVEKGSNYNLPSLAKDFNIDFDAPEVKNSYLAIFVRNTSNQKKEVTLLVNYKHLDRELESAFDEDGTFIIEG